MSAPISGEVQALIAKLQGLDIEQADPVLRDQLSQLVSTTQNALQKTSPHLHSGTAKRDTPNHEPNSHSSGSSLSHRGDSVPAEKHPTFPFVPVDLGGGKPSETAFLKPDAPRQFGIPSDGIIPLQPPLELFHWPEESLSKLGKPELDQLDPAPPAPQDASYRRGYRYVANFDTSKRESEREDMLNIRVPPNITPTGFDLKTQSFISEPIPGLVRVPLGIPMVHLLDGDPNKAVTAVCAHSLESLQQYPEGQEVLPLADRLMKLVWGTENTPGLFHLPGMGLNRRSKGGEGIGNVFPALQTNTPESAAVIQELLQVCHQLYRLVMPLCVSKIEWDLAEFIGRFNNVIAFGGFEPGPTSCQGNSSSSANVVKGTVPEPAEDTELNLEPDEPTATPSTSSGIEPNDSPRSAEPEAAGTSEPDSLPRSDQSEAPRTKRSNDSRYQKPKSCITLEQFFTMVQAALSSSIGAQGKNHGDFQDCLEILTLFILMFKLVPGSDLGPFLWNRGGLYLREQNVHIMFCAFRGMDIHSGYPPTYMEELQAGWLSLEETKKMFQNYGTQVRVGLVMYFSAAAVARTTQIQYSPSLHFLYSPPPHVRDPQRRYYAHHGDNILGDRGARANRLGTEGAFAFKNYLAQCQLKLELDIDTLLQSTTYLDEEGQTQTLQPAMMDIENQQMYERISRYMQYYAWLRNLAQEYSLGVTKPEFKARQQLIQDVLHGKAQEIIEVLGRETRGASGFWTVVMEGSTEITSVPEASVWLQDKFNANIIAEHLKRRGTGPPARDKARSKLNNRPATGKRATHGNQRRKKQPKRLTPEFTESEGESGGPPAADDPSAVDVMPGPMEYLAGLFPRHRFPTHSNLA
ncbi:hypothetical protein B0H14DRAFT_3781638 [Mycena olivaceomarginata]|nr:hypothetical protein B0H14DRAFT_3781638 [Mycena olivaceomarginata]